MALGPWQPSAAMEGIVSEPVVFLDERNRLTNLVIGTNTICAWDARLLHRVQQRLLASHIELCWNIMEDYGVGAPAVESTIWDNSLTPVQRSDG